MHSQIVIPKSRETEHSKLHPHSENGSACASIDYGDTTQEMEEPRTSLQSFMSGLVRGASCCDVLIIDDNAYGPSSSQVVSRKSGPTQQLSYDYDKQACSSRAKFASTSRWATGYSETLSTQPSSPLRSRKLGDNIPRSPSRADQCSGGVVPRPLALSKLLAPALARQESLRNHRTPVERRWAAYSA